jgi:predicted PurR-regulated permease PerM
MPDAPSPAGDWKRLHLWQIQPVRDGVLIAAAVGMVWLGYRLSVVTVPMLLALTLAYLCEPLVRRLCAPRRMSRKSAALGLIFGFFLLVVVPVSLGLGFAVAQGAKFAQNFARHVDHTVKSINDPNNAAKRDLLKNSGANTAWLSIRDYIVEQEKRNAAHQEDKDSPLTPDSDSTVDAIDLSDVPAPSELYQVGLWGLQWISTNAAALGKQALSVGGGAVDAALHALQSLFNVLFGAFLTAFFFFFFCTGYGKVLEFWEGLIPERKKSRVIDLLGQMDVVIAGFVRGRLTICATLIVYYIFAYWMIGVPAPVIVGLVVGALTIIPYVAGAVSPVVMMLMWLGGSDDGWRGEWWWIIGSPLIVLGIQQVLDDYVLTPRIQGKSTNMDTPTILFASIAGGAIAGFYGLLLAIPVAACIRILLKEIIWPRIEQWLAGRVQDPLPIERE